MKVLGRANNLWPVTPPVVGEPWFTMQMVTQSLSSYTDSSTIRIFNGGASIVGLWNNSNLYETILFDCTIERLYMFLRIGTPGTNENATLALYVNGVLNTTLTSTLKCDASYQLYSFTNLGIDISAWDKILLVITWPVRATNPSSILTNFVFWCEPANIEEGIYAIRWGAWSLNITSWSNFQIADGMESSIDTSIRQYIPADWTITACYIHARISWTLWTTENVTYVIRKNWTTDYTVSSTVQLSAVDVNISNESLNIPVSAWDYISIKIVAPTFVTPPTSVRHDFCFVIEE